MPKELEVVAADVLRMLEGLRLPGPLAAARTELSKALDERNAALHAAETTITEPESPPPDARTQEPLQRATAPAELPLSLEAYERACIERALQEAGGSVQEAGRLLGVGKSTMYRKTKRLRLRSSSTEGTVDTRME